jgi:tight adherence protein C
MTDWLLSQLGEPGFSTLLILMVGAAVFLLALALLLALFPASDRLHERRLSLGLVKVPDEKVAQLVINPKSLTLSDRLASLFLPSSNKAREINADRLKLAGYVSVTSLATYYTIRSLLMVLLPLAAYVLLVLAPELQFNGQKTPVILLALAVGMIGPSHYLDRKIEQRQRALRNALPDVLDMLVVCTEAGLALNSALFRVAREVEDIHPEFAAELMIVNAQIRAGIDREQALRGLVSRTGLEDIKSLMVLIIHSLRFGTSIADTLRLYSEEFREKRMQKADEAAATIATKMIFPLVLCFMPAFFIVAVGPAYLMLKKAFGG